MANKLKTGQVALTSGVRTSFGVTVLNNDIFIKSHPSNTAVVWVGDSSVTSGTGYPIQDFEIFGQEQIGSLSDLYAIAYSAGQRVCWATIIKE